MALSPQIGFGGFSNINHVCVSDENSARRVWREADAVCLDLDNTLIQAQGDSTSDFFDYLGYPQYAEANRATANSKKSLSLQAKQMFDDVRPSKQQLRDFVKQRRLRVTPGARELVEALKKRGVTLFIITGALLEMAQAVADTFGVPYSNIFPENLKYNPDGSYRDVGTTIAKSQIIQKIRSEHNFKRIVMLGDGISDSRACPSADAFIGFGGNLVNSNAKEKAPWFVYSFQTLLDELKRNK